MWSHGGMSSEKGIFLGGRIPGNSLRGDNPRYWRTAYVRSIPRSNKKIIPNYISAHGGLWYLNNEKLQQLNAHEQDFRFSSGILHEWKMYFPPPRPSSDSTWLVPCPSVPTPAWYSPIWSALIWSLSAPFWALSSVCCIFYIVGTWLSVTDPEESDDPALSKSKASGLWLLHENRLILPVSFVNDLEIVSPTTKQTHNLELDLRRSRRLLCPSHDNTSNDAKGQWKSWMLWACDDLFDGDGRWLSFQL